MPSNPRGDMITNPGPHWPAGNTPINVGTYSNIKPVIDTERCNGCLLCWLFCPDGAISVQGKGNGEKVAVDYDLCKSCGICVRECPRKAVELLRIER